MKFDQLFIAGIDTYLPPAVSVKQAIADGRYDPREAAETELESILVADDEAAPDMAVRAARGAVARSGIDPAAISLVLHASLYFQGIEFHPTASYIHNAALGHHSALALEVKGTSNGGLACMALAATYLAALPEGAAALITTADNFCTPLFDRWKSRAGMIIADGASAMVLSRQRGFARVLSVAMVSDPRYEHLLRGSEPFRRVPIPIELHIRRAEYQTEGARDKHSRRFMLGIHAAVDAALQDANTELADIAHFVFRNVGRAAALKECQELKIDESATTWRFGRRIGHMGAGDHIAGLSLSMDHGVLNPGDRCMMISIGAGFTWGAAVIEIQERLPLRPNPLFA
jgi:3-oxoacyl-[acyl-carrier-protein] synthase III